MKRSLSIATLVLAQITAGTTLLSLTSCTPVTTAQKNVEPQSRQTVKISGAGAIYPALKVVAEAYEKKVTNTEIIFFPPNQSGGGIAGVKNSLVDIGALTRQLTTEENNGQLTYREIAKDALVVATNQSVKGVKNLQTKDLQKIYSGEIVNWRDLGGPDAKIIVLDRPEDESAKKLLRKYYLGKSVTITSSAVLLSQEPELIRAMQDTPYSIGYFSLAYAIANNLVVNRLSLDNIAATVENVKAEKYLMVRTLGIVYKTTPSQTVQGFLDFVASEEGATELLQSGFVPSTAKK
ncbi:MULTISPECIES: PstS family phosphate ABC transporter substrate-binding protein [Kamptonema]|uniref:PstS family phosphate ABC transporter substrate-binding protein n=1 Tax=Kamptonema TaxID=1501433 RepID=UPI0001DAC91F|nr:MULTISPECIES: substrate-binding domain-containing protein [Kamptonema]CBN54406.1 periplasmic phosphate-binding protein of phosphate ABC transporter [Kamptonema sp. PCC 6506]